ADRPARPDDAGADHAARQRAGRDDRARCLGQHQDQRPGTAALPGGAPRRRRRGRPPSL
ncbi:MAG: hypothetical protein AVDCRST_MAG52-214, partial [uncultured Blastococcus sp.]